MKEDNNIEDLFRSSFDHFEVAPPPVVKEAIDRRIGEASNKRIWWILGLVLLLGTSTLLFFFARSSEKQGNGSSDNQLASNETPANNSTSTTTTHSGSNSSTTQTSTSPDSQTGNKNTVSSEPATGTKKQSHSNGNQGSSLSKNNGAENQSLTSNTGNNKNRSAKTNSPNRKKTSGKKSSGKKSSGKKSSGKKSSGKKNNSGTPDFTDLSNLDLTDIALTDKTNKTDNTPTDSNGKSDPKDPDGTTNNGTPDINSPEKTDSIPAKTNEPPATQAGDSAKTDGNKPNPPKNKTTGENWLASLYVGPSFGINSKSNDELRSVSEKPSFQFSAEINRSLFAGYGLSTGFGFNQRQETFKLTNLQILDSAIVIDDSIPIYGNPNVPDSITGYLDTTYYFDDTLSTDYTQVNRIQTIGIPLYFTKHFSFSDQWGLLVNAGAVFQFYKVSQGELNGTPAPTVNDFSLNVAARFHATYTWNKWMFSAGVSTGWEMKQALIYEGLDRKRYFITPQLGFHFRF